MFAKDKQSLISLRENKIRKRRVILASFLAIALLLLTVGGWIVRNDILLRIKTLGANHRVLIKPIGEKRIDEQLEEQLKELGLKEGLNLLNEPVVKNGTFMATFSGQLTCLLSLGKEVHSQLASLQFIFWRSKIEGKQPKIIDLRFDKPVIEY